MISARVRVLPWLLALLLGLQGCASWFPAARAPVPRAAPFDVLGRVLVSFDGRSFTASVRWVHAADADEISLMTPTGQILMQIREDASGALLTGMDRTSYRASNIEAMTQRALGWELPTQRLQHWISGVAAPGSPAEVRERDAAGKIKQLTQDGWDVSYEYYAPGENGGLPRRMELVRAAQRLRLVIDAWADVVEPPR